MNKNVLRRFSQVGISLIIQAVSLFISAGTLAWPWAWMLLSLSIVIILINSCILPIELIEEGEERKEDAKKWDRILTSISIVPLLGINIIAGLDYRFAWSAGLHNAVNIAGLALYFLSSMFVTWSMTANTYFSTMVRIQTDRGHQVASGGPYAYIRHPGYLGFIIMLVAIPLSLGSLYGVMMSVLPAAIFVIRTSLEDKTLKAELDGYGEYSKNVRYRLIPFIW